MHTNAHERHEKAATGIATRCVLALIPQRAIFSACYICFRRKNDFSGKLGQLATRHAALFDAANL